MNFRNTLWICILFCILVAACQPVEVLSPAPTFISTPTVTPEISLGEDQAKTEEVVVPTPTDQVLEDTFLTQVNISGSVFV